MIAELSCTSWIIVIVVVFIISFIGANLARIKRDGLTESKETINGLPAGMGFKYKNDCNDPDSWTGE